MSVRIGIIGNSFAELVQLPALRWANENGAPNSVVALAGRDAAKARATAREWSIDYATGDWQTVLGREPECGAIDLAIISTPVDLHAPMVRRALESDAAILCEKPFAMCGDEARELAGAAEGRLALIDHQTRWSPWRRAFKQALASGVCGELWAARIQMRMGSLRRAGMEHTWWYDEARGGGVLGAIGSHVLDGVLDQFGERVSSVRADLQTLVKWRAGDDGELVPVTADDAANLWLELESGLPVQVETDTLGFGCERDAGQGVLIELRGSNGTLRLEGETELLFLPHGAEPEPIEVAALPQTSDMGLEIDGMFPRCLPSYLRDVIRAVATGASELAGAATFRDAIHVMDVIDAARESSRTKRVVQVRT